MLHDLESIVAQFYKNDKTLPPVASWQPEDIQSIDIVIDSEGKWLHEGGVFERKALMQLFASILRVESEQYYLVTPQQKFLISVVDVPFIIDSFFVDEAGGALVLVSQCEDTVMLDANTNWQLRDYAGVTVPYVEVRDGLFARLSRHVFYQLIDLAVEQSEYKETNKLYLTSASKKFLLGDVL